MVGSFQPAFNSFCALKLDKLFFDWLRKKLSGKEKPLPAFIPKPHQAKAIKQAKDHFITKNNKRGKLVFPCGAGKSLTGYWLADALQTRHLIVAFPSLSLVKKRSKFTCGNLWQTKTE